MILKDNKLEALQGLRAIAALLVVIDHAIDTLVVKAGAGSEYLQFGYFLGDFGVKTFFLISGFIMVIAHYKDFGRSGGTVGFLKKRLIRVVPLYWLATLVYGAKLTLQGNAPGVVESLKSLFFVPYQDALGHWQPIYGLGWTLNYEMIFYLVFAAALLLKPRWGIALVATVFVSLVFGVSYLDVATKSELGVLFFWGQSIVLFFVAGMFIGVTHLYLAERQRLLSLRFDDGLILASALAGLVCLLALNWDVSRVSGSIEALACILMVAICTLTTDVAKVGPVRRLFAKLGDASYSIYLTHSFLLGPAGRISGYLGMENIILFSILMLIGASILGMLVFRWVEKPITNKLRVAFADRRQ